VPELPTAPLIQSLVVGSGGLLGGAVVRELRRGGRPHATVSVPWGDRSAALAALEEAAERLMTHQRPWRLFWCAGSGVVASDQRHLDDEVETLEAFLSRLSPLATAPGAPPGAVFLASSAGGVYAGSQPLPFTEATRPQPNSPYGEAKLAAEQRLREFTARTGVPGLIGRITNLYGPGQDPMKAQGLITVLCRAHLARRPISIYVSLETARDYVFVDDVARLAVAGLCRASTAPPGQVVTKILASQTGTTVAAILGEFRRITKHRPRVVLGASSLARFQRQDLRFRSTVWRDLDRLVTTSLPAGIAATMRTAQYDLQQPTPNILKV
jgi:UDP-glucose 4-epimerase